MRVIEKNIRRSIMEKRSLFYPLAQEGLTTLRIQYDWKTDHVFLQASKDWDEDFDWSRYNHDFYVESIKTRSARLLNDQETREMFVKYGLGDYLEQVIDLLRQGKHFGIDCFIINVWILNILEICTIAREESITLDTV